MSDTRISATAAASACTGSGGQLAVVPDATTNDFLLSIGALQSAEKMLWIGGTITSGALTWTDGTTVTYGASLGAAPWGETPIEGDCVLLQVRDSSGFLDGKWFGRSCSSLRSYICERAL